VHLSLIHVMLLSLGSKYFMLVQTFWKSIVLINGTPSGFFDSSRGLRHGDPLSLCCLLFLLEVLSRTLSVHLCEWGFLLGFSVRSKDNAKLLVSHLLFANDTLIFCEANSDHLRNLRYVFLCFEAVSKFKINLEKSKLVPVGVVEEVKRLGRYSGCKVPLCL
jgi:hypothetical protein